MGRAERWLALYITFLIVITVTWRWLEDEVYGFSQESFVDSICCIYVAYSLATSVENKMHKILKSKCNVTKHKHEGEPNIEQPVYYNRMQNVDRCVCCGEIIPEGRQVCASCEYGHDVEENK